VGPAQRRPAGRTGLIGADAVEAGEGRIRQLDEAGDLRVVPLDPPHPGLAQRVEALMLLPHEQRAPGAHHVLLPPDLAQVRARRALERTGCSS
jgi:hypothetical protein